MKSQPIVELTASIQARRASFEVALFWVLLFQIPTKYKPEAPARELIVYPVFEGENRSVMRFFPCLRCGLVPNVQLQNLRVGLVFPSAHPGALVTFVSKEPEAKIKLAGIVNENSKALASHCLLVLASTQDG